MCWSSARRSGAIVAAVLAGLDAGGCNALLGIDETVPDRDADGVADDLDNCPDATNPDQSDYNGNGIGDACDPCDSPIGLDLDGDGIDDGCDGCVGDGATGLDADDDDIDDGCDPCVSTNRDDVDDDGIDDGCDACVRGPPHDEDGDTIADGCDNCPGTANLDQAATDDGDLIGDACDGGAAVHVLAMFDAFAADSGLWLLDAGWTLGMDTKRTMTPGDDHESVVMIDQDLIVETRIVQLVPAAVSGYAGIAVTSPPSEVRIDCTVASTGDVTISYTPGGGPSQASTGGPVDVSGPVTVRLIGQSGIAGYDARCEAVGADQVVHSPGDLNGVNLDRMYRVTLVAGGASVAFAYAWAIENQ